MARHFVATSSQALQGASAPISAAPYSFSAWIKLATYQTVARVFTLWNSGSVGEQSAIYITPATLSLFNFVGSVDTYAQSGSPSLNTWVHVCGVWTASNVRTIYLNGAGRVSAPATGFPTGLNRLTIGASGAGSQYFDGDIAHAAFWNVALTAEDIFGLANGILPSHVHTGALVDYWALDGTTSPEPPTVGALSLTVTGATAANSPNLLNAVAQNVCAVLIDGAIATNSVRMAGLSVTDTLQRPTTCRFRMDGSAPSLGADVRILVGDSTTSTGTRVVFAGTITSVSQIYEGKRANLAYDVGCQDYTVLLNRRMPLQNYAAVAADAIANNLVLAYGVGFSSDHVQPSLPVVSISFNGTNNLGYCLSQLATLIGASWFVDYTKDLHFSTSDSTDLPDTLTTPLLDPVLTYTSDLAQVRTRVYVVGAGTTTVTNAAIGATAIAVKDRSIFDASGSLKTDGQVIAYTGITTGSTAAAKSTPAAPNGTLVGGGPTVAVGTYRIGCTYYDTAGVESALGGIATFVLSSANQGVSLTVPTMPTGASCRVYISNVNSTTYHAWNGVGGGIFAYGTIVGLGFTNDGVTTPPSPSTYAPGSTSVNVADTSAFSGHTATSGSNTFTYSGTSVTSGPGTLTGIPDSGAGSITSTISIGATITDSAGAVLTGVTGVTSAMPSGAQVNLFVQRDDLSAQAALDAIEGFDGVHEYTISDQSLQSVAECAARGDADLVMFSTPLVTIRYATLDKKTRSGKTLTVSLSSPTSISASLKIQSVTIDQIDQSSGRLGPRYTAEASSQTVSLEGLLREFANSARK